MQLQPMTTKQVSTLLRQRESESVEFKKVFDREAIETFQVNDNIIKLLAACREPQTLTNLLRELGLRNRKHFRFAILGPAISDGLIELTVPDKPRSRLQRYRLTPKGWGGAGGRRRDKKPGRDHEWTRKVKGG